MEHVDDFHFISSPCIFNSSTQSSQTAQKMLCITQHIPAIIQKTH
ncbi:hypothetical protein NC653_018437 [Populus alba x Populus x berolinensis]|uniref:Uncharacterized protein n=1 Tax=Populus alba x Populus x berolinensis TaxID=444605 RepID=A0AAD6QGI3_9ROSI|nr:hypothetical protein NC653_018437 [Populus alba x Populus x berolinensis]